MIDLKSMTPEELEAYFKQLGQPKFRAMQVFRWLHRGVESFDEMTDLPKDLRERMKADCVVLEALKEGKVLPFQRDWAFQSAINDLDSFTLWLKTAPQVVPMGEVCAERLPQMPHHRSRAHELMGLSAEDVAKYGNI